MTTKQVPQTKNTVVPPWWNSGSLDQIISHVAVAKRDADHARELVRLTSVADIILHPDTALRIATKEPQKHVCSCCGLPLVWYKEPKSKEWQTCCQRSFFNRLVRIKNVCHIEIKQLGGELLSPSRMVVRIMSTQPKNGNGGGK